MLIVIAPLLPLDASPVDRDAAPVAALPSVFMVRAPEVVPEPVRSSISPPTAKESPLLKYIMPPKPLVPEPTLTLTLPPRPAVAAPLPTIIAPVLPVLDVPDENTNMPLTPAAPGGEGHKEFKFK